jgi:hypothetical protein
MRMGMFTKTSFGKMEADYDRQMKESLSATSISWNEHCNVFLWKSYSADQSKIKVGDELSLKLGEGTKFYHGKEWEGTGYVKSIHQLQY